MLDNASRNLHRFLIGDQVHITKGTFAGWKGTIVWVNLDRSYQVCDELVDQHVLDVWCRHYGVWTFDMSDPDPRNRPTVWSVNDAGRGTIAVAYSEEMVLIDSTRPPRVQMKRDFLVSKRIMVVGAHPFKGMKGFVVSVDFLRRNAQVSLDAKTMVSNQTHCISLQDLMLDISNIQ